MRIAVGGISQETSSFTPVETKLDAFRERFLLHGEAILATFSDTNTPIGGFIEAAREHPDVTLVPTMFAEAHPAGPAPAEVFTELVDELVTWIAAAVPVDAMLLDLHGAMVTQGCDDCEGEILARVRQAIGRDIPLVAQLDIHANVSSRMVEAADILVGRRTYPEVDMAARGRDCLELVLPLVGGKRSQNRVSAAALRLGREPGDRPPPDAVGHRAAGGGTVAPARADGLHRDRVPLCRRPLHGCVRVGDDRR